MKSHNLFRISVLCVLLQSLWLSGCATHSSRMVQASADQVSEQAVINQVSTQLEALEARVAAAQANDVSTFAPYDMDKALDALGSARRYYEEFMLEPQKVNKSVSLFFGETLGQKTLSLISEANAALVRAEENKRQADIILGESNENFKWLKKFNAQVNFRYEFADIERAQKSMISMVARGDLDRARARLPQLLNEQKALEIVAAQHFYLNDLSQRIEREGRYDLDRYASLSYGGAVSALNRAKVVIAQDTRNEAAILEAKSQAEFSFEVAHAVASDMKRLVNMDRQEMERWLIMLTTKLGETSQMLGIKDLRNHSLLDQIELIASAAKNQGSQLAPNQAVAVVPAAVPAAVNAAPVAAPTATSTAAVATPSAEAAPASAAVAQTDTALVNRVTKLEQTLSQQIQALADQMKKMQALNQRASVSTPVITKPAKRSYVPLSERKSLFSY
ncbi:MAG: hypothetical protein MI867_07720 [Pseudomonadales bacterium]|nr:hypothetical protein [Pseudomonadales bacterium]